MQGNSPGALLELRVWRTQTGVSAVTPRVRPSKVTSPGGGAGVPPHSRHASARGQAPADTRLTTRDRALPIPEADSAWKRVFVLSQVSSTHGRGCPLRT